MLLAIFPGIDPMPLRESSIIMTTWEKMKDNRKKSDILIYYAMIRNLLVLFEPYYTLLEYMDKRSIQYVVVIPHNSDINSNDIHFIEFIKENCKYYELPRDTTLLDNIDEILELYDYSLIS